MNKKYTQIVFVSAIILVIAALLYVRNKNTIHQYVDPEGAYTQVAVGDLESCLHCHQNTTGYSNYHNPEVIGCSSCHLGNTTTLDKSEAHAGMILIPGNLADAKETCGKCHADELDKVNSSLMTSNSGIIAVDKFAFGEADSPNHHFHIKDLAHSASDKHIRDLCANCHLGAEKPEYGAIDQLSRGGGCIACHLNYSDQAASDLERYIASGKMELPRVHPATDIFVNDMHCFGCHSRSSRISTNYMGLQETLLEEAEVAKTPGYTVMDDKRVYKHQQADVHHKKGLLCIDCHSSHEVMGTGERYTHQEDAVALQCSDCHFKEAPNTIPYDSLDRESFLVFMHREYEHTDKEIIAVEKDGHPLVNTFIDTSGNAWLIGKKDGAIHPLKKQPEVCSGNAHQNVSCSACHSSWASRCIGCHNQFDPDKKGAFDLLDKEFVTGAWDEYVAEFSASQPALGVREHNGVMVIEPAIPGMIMTIDKGSYTGNPGEDVSFHRLYAPNSPHTTAKQVRDCKSCHADAATLGYGMGSLVYETLNGKGSWSFTPDYALNPNDDLPEDAWIPFMKPVDNDVVTSTRTDFRPFSVTEQKRMLFVGACLQCHEDDSKVMDQTLEFGLDAMLKKVAPDCILPE
ncbi:hypothetical protein [Robertkochia sediminum]|uniref:hypothetical protein n=1 Tax=Robertkochia sediminum TaxID=2785326 RepID=UPI0019313FA9|nr:hypothetical protein [Robertkochia sediminum]MBL7471557.1 hypothetical protein [Robertkochia sediminum]